MSNPYDKYVEIARTRYGRLTPFRLGLLVGEAGDDLPSPYPAGGRGDALYKEGLERGRERRKATGEPL